MWSVDAVSINASACHSGETLSKLLMLFWGLAVLQPMPLPHSYGTFSSYVISPSTLC